MAASVKSTVLGINIYAINHWPIMLLALIFLTFPVSLVLSCQCAYVSIVTCY